VAQKRSHCNHVWQGIGQMQKGDRFMSISLLRISARQSVHSVVSLQMIVAG